VRRRKRSGEGSGPSVFIEGWREIREISVRMIGFGYCLNMKRK
jgi:hypothetical protein